MKDDKTKEKDFEELKDEDLDQVAGGARIPFDDDEERKAELIEKIKKSGYGNYCDY